MQNARLGDIQRFFVAEIAVIAWWDGDAQMPTSMLAGFDPALAETAAQDAYKPYDSESFDVGINGYVIKTANRVNAVDTRAPLAMAPTVGRWHASLEMAGLTPIAQCNFPSLCFVERRGGTCRYIPTPADFKG